MKALRNVTIIMSIFVLSCESTDGRAFTYEEARDRGITEFINGNHTKALFLFLEAETNSDADIAEINSWIGWAHFKQSNLEASLSAFNTSLSDQDTVIVDALAGISFLLNATEEYELSNNFIQDIKNEGDYLSWIFHFAPSQSLTSAHLTILAAQNHFYLGDFSSSLSEVQFLVPSFFVDITSPEGQDALAARIEELGYTYSNDVED